MERKMWYKDASHSTKQELIQLAEFQLIVPTQPGGYLSFRDICKDYMDDKMKSLL